MTLFSRILLGVIALAAIIAMLGVFAITQLNQNRYKDRIEQFVLDRTGRDLQINGEVSARLFPRFGLSLTDISMSNTDEFTETEFASVQSGDFQIAALPLLTGRLEIKTVVLNELSLKLQRNADGKTNWDDLLATTAVVETESDDNVMREVEAGTPIIAALSVDGMQISNSNISYSDARDETYVALNEVSLETGTVVLSEPFEFDSSFRVISSAATGMTSTVSAKGEIAVDLVNNIYTLQQVRLSTVNSGDSLPVDPLILSANGQLIADLNAQSVNIIIADGLLSGIPISGEFEATGLADNLRMTGMLSSGEFDAAPVIDQLGFENSSNFQMDLFKSAQVSARFEHTQEVLQIRDFNASVSDINLTGDFQVANPSSSAVLSGWIQTTPFNPAPWVRGFGLNVGEDSLLQTAQFAADVRQSGQLLSFNQIDLHLDDSNITGSVEISDIRADNLPIAYALSVDRINLDDYRQTLSDATQDSVQSSDQDTDQNTDEEPRADSVPAESEVAHTTSTLPVDTLRKLDVEGELTIGEVTLAGVTARNTVLPLIARNNKIEITEASADLYSGTLLSTASLNVQADEPLLAVTGSINSLDAGALLQDAMDSEAPLTGIANLSMDITSSGNGWSQLLAQASGALSLRVTEGQLTGFDIASELHNAGNQILDNSSALGSDADQQASDAAPVTDFSVYSLSAVVVDGVLKSDDLIFLSPYLQITGEGGLNVNTRTVDYLLQLKVDEEVAEQTQLQRFAGVELAIPLRGPFTDVSMDLPEVLKNAFQAGLIREVKSRYTTSIGTQVSVAERIEAEKEALRLRLQEQQAAANNLKPQPSPEITSQESELTRKLAREKAAMKERFKNNLEKHGGEKLDESQVKP